MQITLIVVLIHSDFSSEMRAYQNRVNGLDQ
jgi:hypothetical protein